jgi:hypothetical protein
MFDNVQFKRETLAQELEEILFFWSNFGDFLVGVAILLVSMLVVLP